MTSSAQMQTALLSPLFKERFRFIQPALPPLSDVIALYGSAYESGTLTNAALVGRFEAAVAERLGVRHCVAVSSCTTGLMLVMRALGLSGDVLLPSFTFFATGHAAAWNNLRPVFVDCDRETWTIDCADLERKLTPRTTAVVAVHLYGNPCNVDGLERFATANNLKLIFDAAHGFGSTRRGRPVGQFGDAEVFSLSPTKLLVAGEGGLVTTNDATLAHRIRAGRNYGDLGAYDPELIGINARMSEFNAALGLAGLPLMDEKVRRRQVIARTYTDMLADVPGVSFQKVDPSDCCSYKDYSVLIDPARFGLSRDEVGAALLAENIETKKYFYPPLHEQTLYRDYYDNSNGVPNTDRVAGTVLSLPIYEDLPDETVQTVAAAIRNLHLSAKRVH